MVLHIIIGPGGSLKNGLLNGPGEIYDGTNKYIRKGYFIKSKLNGDNCVIIDYEPQDGKLLQLKGTCSNDAPTGSIEVIEYNGVQSVEDLIATGVNVDAVKKICTYVSGVRQSVDSETAIQINVTATKHPTRDVYTSFLVNEVL